jgi:hypothetical protein
VPTPPQVCVLCHGPLSAEDVQEQQGWCKSCQTAAIDLPNPLAPPNRVAAISLEDPAQPTFVDLSKVETYHPPLMGLTRETMMPSIRHPKWPGQDFFMLSISGSPDGRWFALVVCHSLIFG